LFIAQYHRRRLIGELSPPFLFTLWLIFLLRKLFSPIQSNPIYISHSQEPGKVEVFVNLPTDSTAAAAAAAIRQSKSAECN
jgi:hypothetical protein